MSNDSKDRFARVTSILALFVALVAVVVPYIQQSKQFEAQQTESLNVILNPAVNGPLLLTDHNYGDMGQVVQMPWELTISNTSNRQLSIINKRISVGDSPDSQYYTGIDGGIYTLDYQRTDLPIKLEAGESKVYYIYVGAMIPKVPFEIMHKLNAGNSVTDRDAMRALGKAGIDIYGRPVKYQDHGDDTFMIEFNPSDTSPIFWINLYTGNGNRFYGAAAKYGLIPTNIL